MFSAIAAKKVSAATARGSLQGLSTSIIKNQTYYYKVLDGKKIYIGKADCKEVAQLQKRRFIENSVKRIDQNCVLMEQLLKGYQSVDPEGGHGRRNKGLSDAAGMQLFLCQVFTMVKNGVTCHIVNIKDFLKG